MLLICPSSSGPPRPALAAFGVRLARIAPHRRIGLAGVVLTPSCFCWLSQPRRASGRGGPRPL
eukprot:7251968-Pyramimonas_sp.AAC.1